MSSEYSLDSEAARKRFTQCQTCLKSKESSKLRVCTGCKVTLYCSAQCQKKDWPQHKARCKDHQGRMAAISNLDKQKMAATPTMAVSHRGTVQLLPSELLEEMRAFMNKFGPSLFQAAYNACDIVNHYMGWKQIVLYVFLERLPVVDPSSRPWSRFRIAHALACPMPVLFIKWGEKQYRSFVEKKEAEERRQEENGFMGAVTTILGCDTPGDGPGSALMHDISVCGFRSDSAEELDITPLWSEKLIEMVEKTSGRPVPPSGARTPAIAQAGSSSQETEVD